MGKVTQETVNDLERSKKEAENIIARKEKDAVSSLQSWKMIRLWLPKCRELSKRHRAELNKEKKHAGENSSKAAEDLSSAEDKVGHLNKIKNKLEATLGELQIHSTGRKGQEPTSK